MATKRFLDTKLGVEVVRGVVSNEYLQQDHVLQVDETNPFFSGFDESKYKLVIDEGIEPYLIEAELDESAALQAAADNDAIVAQSYLDATDWYIVRMVETGVPVPEEVTANRAAARIKAGEKK